MSTQVPDPYAEKAKDLINWFKTDPVAADKYVRTTLNWTYQGVATLLTDMAGIIDAANEIRGEGIGAVTKIRKARNIEKEMKEIMAKHKIFFDQFNQKMPSIIAVMMYAVKEGYTTEMGGIINLIVTNINQMSGKT